MKVCSDCRADLTDASVVLGRCPLCSGIVVTALDPEPLIGRTLDGRYLIEARLGSGGMGAVYRATQLAVQRPVAVKVMPPVYASRPRSTVRFEKEARAISHLNHPNIVTVHDFGRAAEGYLYLVMELLEGQSLSDLLCRGPLSLRRAVRLMEQVCSALSEAHGKGVVHCDLKPDNIFVVNRHDQEDAVKVLDFGIAAMVTGDSGSSSGSSSREVSGTPDYMSPERILGRRVGPETDLYSLGIILYLVLTGSRPYAGTTPMEVCLRHLNDPIPVLPPVLPADGCPSWATQALLDRLLHKDPLARLSSAEEARAALSALLRAEGGPGDAAAAPALEDGPTTGSEAQAPAHDDRSVHVGDQPTQVRCPRCGNFNAGHWRFCSACGASMDEPSCSTCGAPLAHGSVFCTVCGLQHADERDAVAPGGATESRRQVSTVHALASFEPESGLALDLEDRIELLRPLQQRWAEAVRALGGTVHGDSGEGICAIFGVPATGQTDALSAVRCAMTLARVAADMEAIGSFVFRCGVSTGPALVRRRSSRSWSVKGDVVVQAALLAGDAPPRGVLCCDSTWQEVREAVVGSAHPTPDGRGAARWLLRDLRSHSPDRSRRPGAASAPLFGRDTELATLQGRFLATVHRGSPHLVTVVGAPGVGKSRLVNELAEWVQETLPETVIVRARAVVQPEQAPYQLIRQVVTSAAAAVPEPREHAEVIAPWLDGAVPLGAPPCPLPGLDPGGDGDSLLVQRPGVLALRQLLHSLTRGRAAVIVLDDLHAADTASLDLLSTLLDGLTGVPVLVVCCAAPQLYELRPQWDSGGGVRARLDLRPLAPGPMGRLVDALLERVVPPSTAARNLVVQRSEGNPWFAEEVVRLLVQRAVIEPQTDGTWLVQTAHLDRVTMPRSIEGLLQARVDVLGDDERAVLSAAAIVGTVFWEGVVADLLPGMDTRTLSDVLSSLRRAGLVRKRRSASLPGEREYRFAGGLLREVVHGGLLRKARRAGHQAVARWLEARVSEGSGDLAGTLAAHHEEGGELARAFHWYRVAADRAEAILASADARRCLSRAIVLAPSGEDEAGVLALHERLGDVLLQDGEHDEARASFVTALSLAGDNSSARAGLLCKIGRTWHLAGRLDLASESLDQALAAAGDTPSAVGLAILAEIGWVEWLRGRFAEAESSLEQGVALAGELPTDAQGCAGRDRSLATLLAHLGVVAQSRGNRARAAEHFSRAGEHYLAAGLKASAATMDMNVGLVHLAAGRAELAVSSLSPALATFEVLGYPRGISGAHAGLGRAFTVLGRPRDAEAHLILARNIGAECGATARVADACCGLAELALRQGQPDRAHMEALRAVEEALRCHDVEVCAGARRVLGLALGALGRVEEAHETFRAAVAALEARGVGGSAEALARTSRAWGGYCLASAGEGERRVELLRRGAGLLRRAAATYQGLGLTEEADEALLCLRRTIPLA